MDHSAFEAIVADAMLAPSAHNTQPVRWALKGNTIQLFVDLNRRLPVADPDERDLNIACGAAVEGTVLALATRGSGAEVTWIDRKDDEQFRHMASITPHGAAQPGDLDLARQVRVRITHRAGFITPPNEVWAGLDNDNVTLVRKPEDIVWLAIRVDDASAMIMRDRLFRKELLAWMRLRKGETGYHRDGMNREVMAMDRLSAFFVAPILGTKVYDILWRCGLGPTLSGEKRRTEAAGAVALFHWPVDGSLFEAGRAFYRYWLATSAQGLVGWPAAALADDAATSAAVCSRFSVPARRVLLNTIRLGYADGATPSRTRLKVTDVIL